MNKTKKHFTVSALIIDNNKVLLVYHKKLKVWLYPGGHVEENENPDEALLREIKEETGLEVEIISDKDNSLSNQKKDVSSLHLPYAFLCELAGDHYHNDLIYKCRIKKSCKLKYNKDESRDIGFFNIREIKKLQLFDNFRTLLKKVLIEK
ncbi:MAG: DNA mismatch repair protein MutT [Candidatus Moranbacteria bacterium CG_4_9_14_3_um_filter_40_7]|nr:MAG: DNA mismatch repair protein MutT [Candidatus Moranbacteria bacterium CG_4_9_14_3_um_filter_40_7]